MRIRNCLLSMVLAVSMVISLPGMSMTAAAAETGDDAQQTTDVSIPSEEADPGTEEVTEQKDEGAAVPEEQSSGQSNEEVTEDKSVPETTENAPEEVPAAVTEPAETETKEAADDPAEADTAAVGEEAKAEPAAEEIKETTVDSLQAWEGPGLYNYYDSKGKLIGYKYRVTSKKEHKGFKTIDGYPYYFDAKTGWLKAGWFTVNGYRYYGSTASKFEDGRGILYTGMKVIGGHHYYFFGSTRDGHYGKTLAKNTWVTTGGEKFYAGKDGKLIGGFKTIGGKGYYFYPSGSGSHKYGQMAKGWFTYNNFKYYANPSSGVLTTGFKTIDGIHYYFYPKTSGKHYAKTMATGWFTVNGYKYYANKAGKLQTGWKTIDGKTYYFWPKTEGKHYSRTMACNGTFNIGGRKYTFKKDGSLDTSVDVTPFFEAGNIYGLANAAGLYVDADYPIYVIQSDGIHYYQDDESMMQMINCSNPRYRVYGFKVGDTESTVRSKINATGKFKKSEKDGSDITYFYKNNYHAGYYSAYLNIHFKNGKVSNWSIGIYGGD